MRVCGVVTQGQGCIGRRGVATPPPPLAGAQPTPSHSPPDAKCQTQRHLQPTVTAPDRFGNPLQPPAPRLAPVEAPASGPRPLGPGLQPAAT